MALIAIRRFLTTIDFKSPNLKDLAVLEIYETTQKQKNRETLSTIPSNYAQKMKVG